MADDKWKIIDNSDNQRLNKYTYKWRGELSKRMYDIKIW